MNTDIYCEIDQKIAIEIYMLRTSLDQPAKEILKSPFAKWINKTRKWREKCQKRMQEKPWSITKDVWIARVK